ncbi:hypothetical protein JVX90_05365 [Gordonia sp. PDNC005]|uniref:hypothetical protein n=1 Tax=unclassified Gordonia (in: high G+C Gram-positive bacteria) TaxID=2657482 RepID=UPI001965E35B|nr:hypothetical protein [Gordonia sp. PDNC005]QRY63647.1 hypothetical protein JVX90_05365 [Gordonia sp. PDNC005]
MDQLLLPGVGVAVRDPRTGEFVTPDLWIPIARRDVSLVLDGATERIGHLRALDESALVPAMPAVVEFYADTRKDW